MKKIFAIAVLLFVCCGITYPQGCIPVRTINAFGQYNFSNNAYTDLPWQLNITNRYFKSSRDFREKTDQKTPEQNKNLNETYTLDVSINKILKRGWSLNIGIPVNANARTTSFEHGGMNTLRRSTRSFGAGDLRFTVYKWVLQPAKKQKWNMQAGLGIKFATGDYKYQDNFYRDDTTKILSAVNPGIQLGDGGTGIITEMNTFYILNKTFSFYGNFYYLITPREQNGTGYSFGRTPTALQIRTGASVNSVPDVFSIRAGVFINAGNFSFSAGIRDEGTPVHDLVGGSEGLRRAGYNFSVEPGILYNTKTVTLFAYAPVVIGRRIKQNIPDKKTSDITGVKTVGPGASPDYILIAGVSCRF
ncbi:MAG: hypothetical protein V4685_02870 [Bacteroidota bacterium]